ncbi:MAG: DMT family transporter [Clostridiales bacterium]
MKPKYYMILAMLLFGSIGLFVRYIDMGSGQIALIRGALGSFVLIAAGMLIHRKITWCAVRKNFLLLILSGAGLGFSWIFLFEAYDYTTIANATLSCYFAPLFVVLASPFILKEHLSLVKAFCIFGAVAGMFLVVGFDISGGNFLFIGIGYGLFAAALYAMVIIINKFFKDLTGLEAAIFQLFFSTLVVLPYVAFTQGFDFTGVSSLSWFLVVILGIVHTGVGYLIYFSAMQKLPGQTVASLCYIDPVSAIIMSGVVLGETLGLVQVLGAVLILGATFISDRYGNKKFTKFPKSS